MCTAREERANKNALEKQLGAPQFLYYSRQSDGRTLNRKKSVQGTEGGKEETEGRDGRRKGRKK